MKILKVIFLKNKVLNEDKSLNLFGKHFYYINLEDALGSINQIIVNDEYNLKDFLKEDFVVFDIGSNIGISTCFAANLVKKGKIFAFEPVSFVFDFLKKNTIEYEKVECYKIGFGSKIEEKEILIRQWAPSASTIQDSPIDRPHQSFNLKEKIEILTLDIFVKEKKLEKIDFIKIDVERYEIKVLKGGIETIKNLRPILGISLHNPFFEKEIKEIFDKEITKYEIKKSEKDPNGLLCLPK
jgi:FkbM family methyltransferase